jgi:N-acetylgalactosamine-N,N'-diacetylbacillosaminyl-diphospho-undecaprenol 4-alpha-N-acetylgalactosaminyltransferase
MKLKVAIFINSITAGGAERVVSLLLHQLNKDFDIYLVLLHNKIEYELPADQKLFCFNQPENENPFLTICKLPLLAYRYKKFCDTNKIDKSFSFLKRANYINCLSRVLGSTARIIISERTYLSAYLKSLDTPGRLLGKYLTKVLYPKADLVVPNSLLIQIDLQEKFNLNNRFYVINNPIDVKAIEQLQLDEVDHSLFDQFTFIHVGGFRAEKNHGMLVDAFNLVKDLDCKLLLVGKSLGKAEDEKKIREKVEQMNLQSRIIFVGFDSNPYKYLHRSGCFVLTSNFEGFPNSLQEALACNLPVISTDCRSGPREILAPGTDVRFFVESQFEIAKYGMLVPVNNAKILAEAMRHMYNDKELQSQYRSRAMVRASDYDVSRVVKEFNKVLLD